MPTKQPSKTNWKNIEKEFKEEFELGEGFDDDGFSPYYTQGEIIGFFRQKFEQREHDNEILVNTILDTKAEERKALIKELGDEIEKMKINEPCPFNEREIPPCRICERNQVLSDIKEILNRYL